MTIADRAVGEFEVAADAVVEGDAVALVSLLSANPELVRARSARKHRATLLHYVSANGVEDERQKTPGNIVAIAEMLLKAGAAVDAEADVYGGGATTLGLVATSYPPRVAGLQNALMEKLLEYGAALDPERKAAKSQTGPYSLVNACLANGRIQAAEFLAERGAPVDLEAAAGLGLLDKVESLLDSRSEVVTEGSKERGFCWACEYGRVDVVRLLLDCEVDIAIQDRNGQTGLHWAAIGGSGEVVRLLLQRGAPLEVQNVYGGTVLGQALWSAAHGGDAEVYAEIVRTLVDAGAKLADRYPPVNEAVDRVLLQAGGRVDPALHW